MSNTSENWTKRRDAAIVRHKAGDLAGAIAAYDGMLKDDPEDADCLGLLALALHHAGRHDASRRQWIASLARPADPPIHLRNLNNLIAAAIETGAGLDAGMEITLPDWPAARMPLPSEKEIAISAGRGLARIGRPQEALRLADIMAPFAVADLNFARNIAEIQIAAGQPERAHRLLEDLSSDGNVASGELLLARAATAHMAGLADEASRLTQAAAAVLPAHITAAEPGQQFLIGVANPVPHHVTTIMSPQLFHFSGNSPASLAWRYNHLYRFWSVFPEAAHARAAVARLPKANFILNNWVNAELLSTPDTLARVTEFVDELGLPVLNHPRHAALATRQRNAERLTGIEGLVVPRLVRFRNDPERRAALARSLGESIGFPLIIRDTFSQMGKDAAMLTSESELLSFLDQAAATELYAIAFIDNPVGDGIFRKIRAAIIGDEIIISHVHFGERWNVHRESAGGLSLAPAAEDFARTILFDPERALGKTGIAALREIRTRIPLDLYGIDFDILPDGRLVFFEANAAMNISLGGAKSKATEPIRVRMREALHRMFERTAGSLR